VRNLFDRDGMQASINTKKAAKDFARHANDAYVETDGLGPRLYRAARGVVIAAALAAAAATSAAAADSGSLKIPYRTHTNTLLNQANDALEATRKPSLLNIFGDSIDEVDDCAEAQTWQASELVDLYKHLNLPENADFTNHNRIKGIVQCLAEFAEDRFGDEDIRGPYSKRAFGDVGGALAAAKYSDDDAYLKSMLAIEAASAATWVMNGNEKVRDENLVRLEAAGLAMTKFSTPEAIRQLRDADVWQLTRIAMAVSTHAEQNVRNSKYRPGAFYQAGSHLAQRLDEAGLKGAAFAAAAIAPMNLARVDVCDDVRNVREERKVLGTVRFYCPLRADKHPEDWDESAEVRKRFGADAISYIDSVLAKPSQTSSLKQ